jgi:amidohydrolase
LNGIVSRKLDPFEPAIVSIGAIHGGDAENVIPEQVELKGTIRFTSLDVQKRIREEVTRAFDVARALGGDYDLKFEFGGMPLINDTYVADVIAKVGMDILGQGNVHKLHKTLGAEDFPEFLKHAPGAMYTLGTRIEGREVYELHHPKFDIDERALPIGTAVLVETTMRFLNSE